MAACSYRSSAINFLALFRPNRRWLVTTFDGGDSKIKRLCKGLCEGLRKGLYEGLHIKDSSKDSTWRTLHEGLCMKDSAWRTPREGLLERLCVKDFAHFMRWIGLCAWYEMKRTPHKETLMHRTPTKWKGLRIKRLQWKGLCKQLRTKDSAWKMTLQRTRHETPPIHRS